MTRPQKPQVPPVLDTLFCALRDPVPRADLALKARGLGEGDWRSLADLAADHHRVGPRLWSALKMAARDAVPGDVAARLEAEVRQATIHALASQAEAVRVAEAFGRIGIEPCLLKGWALEQELFGRIGRRVTRDLDLLIDRREIPAASELLRDLGYSCNLAKAYGSNEALDSFMRFAHHLVFFRSASGITIELHARPFRNEHLLPIETLATEPRQVKTAGGSVRYRVPTLPWNFVYLALHGYVHRWERAKWLVDVPAVVRRLSGDDWRWIREQARRLAVERTLGIALVLSRDLLGMEVPAPARPLADKADGSYLAGACRRELLATEPYANRPPLGRWLDSHVINLSASSRPAVKAAALRSLIVRESDVLPSRLANRFQSLHYLSAAVHVPQRLGQRLLRRIF